MKNIYWMQILLILIKSFFFLSLLILASSCSLKKEDKGTHFPFVPDTNAYPNIHLRWDRQLDNNNVEWLGAYGVWEGVGGHVEIAGEIEIHPDHGGENIYAVSDGLVVDIQIVANHGDAITPNQIEGIWIRYGRNFLMKYVHVGYPTVNQGDVIQRGQILGKTVEFNGKGFWELATYYRSGENTFVNCPYYYFDAESKNLLLNLWNNPQISRTAISANADPWCDGDAVDSTATVNREYWMEYRKFTQH